MKTFILAVALLFSAPLLADVTASWTPGPAVPDVPVDEYRLYCTTLAAPYGAFISIPAPTVAVIFTQPDGANKCVVTSVSNTNFTGTSVESDFSEEVIFYVQNGVVTNPSPNPPSLVIN